jgi:hypothetical protein
MCGCGVKIVVVLFNIFSMVAFMAVQSEQSFLKDSVLSVPESQRQTEILLIVRNSGDSIFSPSIGSTASMVVWEIFPGGAEPAVVLSYGAPLPLCQIRTPLPPRVPGAIALCQALLLFIHRLSNCIS